MVVTIRQLYNKIQHSHELTLLAGENGLNSLVRWVHTVESIDMSDFLRGNEITLMTGVALKSEQELIKIIKRNINNKASGTIVNIGPFIKRIPPELITYCNERNYPLFTAPWHVYLADVIRIITYELLQSEKKETELSNGIRDIIFSQKISEDALILLEKYGYEINDYYCVAVIQLPNDDENTMLQLKRKMDNYLIEEKNECISFLMNLKIIVIFKNDQVNHISTVVQGMCRTFSAEFPGLIAGIGGVQLSVYKMFKSYEQAIQVLNLVKKSVIKKSVCMFSELDFFELFLSIDDQEVIKDYKNKKLYQLEKYDEMNNTTYLQTLESYLKNNCSINEAAKELFVHRNTVNYQISRISQILERNLNSFKNRCGLYLAIQAKHFLQE